MATELISFQEALDKSSGYNCRHLLLGNGFSIACIPTIFSYNSLFEETNFDEFPEIKKAFELLQTTDFELVIHALEKASLVLPSYKSELSELSHKMNVDAQKIKELLISTIASRHPAYPAEVEESKYKACRIFLANFIDQNSSNKGRIYSLNYDLLLYWALMHDVDGESSELTHNDGFGRDSYYENGEVHFSDYVSWQGKSDGQNVHYLHGALHLFDSGHQLEKFTWTDTGVPLIDQARGALTENKFPLFVSEGDHEKKLQKITHSAYLFHSYESFEGVSSGGWGKKPGNTCMFTYGVSFSDNDSHIFNIIANGRIKHLFVGIYGDPNSPNNTTIIARSESLKRRRSQFALEITYYDASTAKVWGI